MTNIYYIGGSPCSGKSTIAELISKKYNLYYFKVDDFLEKYIQMGALKGYEICKKQSEMNAEQIWMRDPLLQCKEELEIYQEMFEFIQEDLKQINNEKGIITEGAAYLPALMKNSKVLNDRYISITPTEEFQVFHYRKREWVPFILEGCSDKEKAFCNWMDRDILFAKEVQKQCSEEEYVSLVNNGEMAIDEMLDKVIRHFGLEETYGKEEKGAYCI